MRQARALLALLVSLAALAACGPSGPAATDAEVELLRTASERLADAGTVQFESTSTWYFDDQTEVTSTSGKADFSRQALYTTTDWGGEPGLYEVLLLDGTRFTHDTSETGYGDAWVTSEAESVTAEDLVAQLDWDGILYHLADIEGHVRVEGPATVRGIVATGYSWTIDFADYSGFAEVDSDELYFRATKQILSEFDLRLEAWLDSEGTLLRARFFSTWEHRKLPGDLAGLDPPRFEMQVDYFGFGEPVEFLRPPSDQAMTLDQWLEDNGYDSEEDYWDSVYPE